MSTMKRPTTDTFEAMLLPCKDPASRLHDQRDEQRVQLVACEHITDGVKRTQLEGADAGRPQTPEASEQIW